MSKHTRKRYTPEFKREAVSLVTDHGYSKAEAGRSLDINPNQIRPGSLTLAQVRQIISDVVNARRTAGDSNLHYLDGLDLFGEADVADLPDDLHPNAAGYARMGKRFRDRVFGPGGVFAPLT